jgi:subtilisin-like proprotein convertase family protein
LSQNVPLSAELRNQITALQAEKESRTPAQRKMDSQLVHLVRKQRGEKLGAGLEAFEKGVKASESGSELVDLNCIVSEPLLAALKAANGQIVASVPRFNSVRVRLPVTQLEAIAARDDVSFVKPAVRAMTHVGAVTTEGDIAHRSNTARSTLSATGRGVRIGVISDSVDSLTASQASGELGPVTVLPGQSGLGIGGSGEGTAMLEIVHDLAPDAELFFASAFLSEAQFAQNILDLRTAGCDIIVDDVGYFDESPLQDGPVAQAVNAIVADGGLYFSAAGNEGNKNDGTSGAWEGDFADAGPTGSSIPKAGRLHSFGANAYNILTEASGYATLFWADPAGASANDYDLYVLDASGQNVIGASTNIQSGRQDPFEIAQAFVTGSRLVVVKSATAAPRFLHLNTLRGTLEVSTSGTIQGHPAAAGAFAVAATPATSLVAPFVGGLSNPVETFSTDGNRRVFFQADGTAVTPGDFSSTGGSVRLKPDLTAADGVKTSVPGFNPFFGTSAAAPHAAAIAAQIWSRNRTLTSQQVREALIGSAIDIEEAGADRDSGAGIVNALAGTQLIPGGVIIVPGAVTIAAESYSPANGRIDPGETLTVNVPIQNIGSAPTEDLTVTLLSTGGIFNPGAAQSYGTLTSGSSDSRSFTFQGIGPIGTIAKATFQLSDGSAYLGSFSSNFTLGATGTPSTFTHAAATTIPTVGVANPYPSSIAVSGFTGSIGKITVRLTNFSHTFPADIDVLLVSPSGKKVVLMSNAGSGNSVSGITLTFDDGAASSLGSVLATGTFKPTALDDLSNSLPAPAPAGPYQNTLSAFTGGSPNGTWQLWVRDEAGGDSGSIGSWSLSIAPNTSLTGGAGPDITPALVQSQSSAVVGALSATPRRCIIMALPLRAQSSSPTYFPQAWHSRARRAQREPWKM